MYVVLLLKNGVGHRAARRLPVASDHFQSLTVFDLPCSHTFIFTFVFIFSCSYSYSYSYSSMFMFSGSHSYSYSHIYIRILLCIFIFFHVHIQQLNPAVETGQLGGSRWRATTSNRWASWRGQPAPTRATPTPSPPKTKTHSRYHALIGN